MGDERTLRTTPRFDGCLLAINVHSSVLFGLYYLQVASGRQAWLAKLKYSANVS